MNNFITRYVLCCGSIADEPYDEISDGKDARLPEPDASPVQDVENPSLPREECAVPNKNVEEKAVHLSEEDDTLLTENHPTENKVNPNDVPSQKDDIQSIPLPKKMESPEEIIEYLRTNGHDPTAYPQMDSYDEWCMNETATFVGEEKLVPICVFRIGSAEHAALLRGSSGKFYLDDDGICYELGDGIDSAMPFLTGEKKFTDARIIDPNNLLSDPVLNALYDSILRDAARLEDEPCNDVQAGSCPLCNRILSPGEEVCTCFVRVE